MLAQTDSLRLSHILVETVVPAFRKNAVWERDKCGRCIVTFLLKIVKMAAATGSLRLIVAILAIGE